MPCFLKETYTVRELVRRLQRGGSPVELPKGGSLYLPNGVRLDGDRKLSFSFMDGKETRVVVWIERDGEPEPGEVGF